MLAHNVPIREIHATKPCLAERLIRDDSLPRLSSHDSQKKQFYHLESLRLRRMNDKWDDQLLRSLHHDRKVLSFCKNLMNKDKYEKLEQRLLMKSWILTGGVKYNFEYDALQEVIMK